MKQFRPEVFVPKSTSQKIFDAVGTIFFTVSTLYMLISLKGLPNKVPIHFNLAGEADGFGSKYVVLILPLIALLVWLPMQALEKRPHLHNYPEKLTENNFMQFYRLNCVTMNFMKNAILVFFGLLQLEILLAAKEADFTFGVWLVFIIVSLTVLPIMYRFIKGKKINA